MRACIIGLGYVGLTLAVYLAHKGVQVHGVDTSENVIESLKSKKAHFFEENFDSMLDTVINNGTFTFGNEITANSDGETVYIVTVGTPLRHDHKVNLQPIETVCESLKNHLSENDTVILRSTVRIGVTRDVVKPILDKSRVGYSLCFCPERTLEGAAFDELANLPQIIAGVDERSLEKAEHFFNTIGTEVLKLPKLEEAEMVKLINNSERDLMFALANEIALMCDEKQLNAFEVINAANFKYSRSNLKKPGLVGGPCLEKDPHILTESFHGSNYLPKLFTKGREINETLAQNTLNRAFSYMHDKLSMTPTKIGILGFAFKGHPATGDMRGSLVFSIISAIHEQFPYIDILGHDFLANHDEMMNAGVSIAQYPDDVIKQCDFIILQNNHSAYSDINWHTFAASKTGHCVVVDFWNQFKKTDFSAPFKYLNLGSMQEKENV